MNIKEVPFSMQLCSVGPCEQLKTSTSKVILSRAPLFNILEGEGWRSKPNVKRVPFIGVPEADAEFLAIKAALTWDARSKEAHAFLRGLFKFRDMILPKVYMVFDHAFIWWKGFNNDEVGGGRDAEGFEDANHSWEPGEVFFDMVAEFMETLGTKERSKLQWIIRRFVSSTA